MSWGGWITSKSCLPRLRLNNCWPLQTRFIADYCDVRHFPSLLEGFMSDRARHYRRLSRKPRAAAVCESLESRRLLALSVPAYNSLPGAFRKLFLDFDGNAAIASWTTLSGSTYSPHGAGSTSTAIPGYNIDSDPN